jgi:hypothetical protein
MILETNISVEIKAKPIYLKEESKEDDSISL